MRHSYVDSLHISHYSGCEIMRLKSGIAASIGEGLEVQTPTSDPNHPSNHVIPLINFFLHN